MTIVVRGAAGPVLLLAALALMLHALWRFPSWRRRRVGSFLVAAPVRTVLRVFLALVAVKSLAFYMLFDGSRLVSTMELSGALALLGAMAVWFELRLGA